MKKIFLLITLLISTVSFSQILDPVEWSTSVEQVSETEYDLVIKATIEPKWHLYSQILDEGGPIATAFTFNESDNYLLIGTPTEDEGHSAPEPAFDNMMVKYFENEATFKQRIKVNSTSSLKIEGEVEYMVCDDSQCLPPTYVDLSFNIKGSEATSANVDKEGETSEVSKPKKIKKTPTKVY